MINFLEKNNALSVYDRIEAQDKNASNLMLIKYEVTAVN